MRRYLDDPPDAVEIGAVLDRLGLEPWDIARTAEPVAAELGLADWPRDPAARGRWIDALAEHPILIQRPIITADDGTRCRRPAPMLPCERRSAEQVLELRVGPGRGLGDGGAERLETVEAVDQPGELPVRPTRTPAASSAAA